jgi:hypothetical protein
LYQDQKSATATEREVTFNDRLNKAVGVIGYQCERIESVLSRVNGTPQKLENAAVKAPTPMHSMQGNLDNLEALADRLTNLSGGVERIA